MVIDNSLPPHQRHRESLETRESQTSLADEKVDPLPGLFPLYLADLWTCGRLFENLENLLEKLFFLQFTLVYKFTCGLPGLLNYYLNYTTQIGSGML